MAKAQPTADLERMAASVLANIFSDERPEDSVRSSEGTEHIERDDIQLPRLTIAQSLSPEIQEGDPKLIEGLKNGDMFNTLTKEIYGRGPIHIVPLRGDKPRFVEFIPRAEGGGVRDPFVAPDDPRTKFTTGDDGKRKNPIATKFYDYVFEIFHADGRRETVACSFKSSGLKVATSFNAMLKLRNAPIYEQVYRVTSRQQKNSKGVFFQFALDTAGWIKEPVLKADLKEKYESMKIQKITFDTVQDPADPEHEDDSFDYGAHAPAEGTPEAQM